MKILIILLLACLPATLSAQTYEELFDQANACVARDSLRQAEKLLVKALEQEPKNSKNVILFANLGLVRRQLGEYEKAAESYSLALNMAPESVPILLGRAALYMDMGKTDAAYADYCQVIDEDKNNKEALQTRAYIYVTRRDYPTARNDYNHLLELDPQNYSGRLGLATLNQKEGKYRESLDILNKMIAEMPRDAILYVARASVERDMKHDELALIDLEEATRLDASLSDAYLLRGDIYLDQKKKALAKADYQKTIELGVPPAELYERLKMCR
ncbi:MAG: tetratricopeptide repeat protein [Mediterranea sp.]|jgi:tetratricopeptide (TPR) repeat protein|nr:tetratricopeptide repeat protein [Mediterranea sp.]